VLLGGLVLFFLGWTSLLLLQYFQHSTLALQRTCWK
jgi:uncharacterized membrane protein